jgi:hypothetical protein
MESPGFRDAIHVPFIVVTCDVTVEPGTKCSLRSEESCVRWEGRNQSEEPEWHGVADPFRESKIIGGESFRLMIRKECFSGLTHNFQIEVGDRGGTSTCHQVCDIW